MGCKQLRADLNFAWPSSEIAVMGASGAVAVLYARDVKAKKEAGEDVKAFIAEKEEEYSDLFANPYQAAQYGYIDDVIEPRYTRSRIIRAFEMLQTKRLTNPLKKHSNIPL
jgi:acetyl-CoA carboxylase carboxyltransferase component